MENKCYIGNHEAYNQILDSRNIYPISPDTPLWKLKLTDEEYESLKDTLGQNIDRLERYGAEAALCYAEWWRRDYAGGACSREGVCLGLGLPGECWKQLFEAARQWLKTCGFALIRSQNRNEYFRSLLNQGGLPVNYIKNGNIFGGFTRFLTGLVKELSSLNIDWKDNNIDLIKSLSCIGYLGQSYKNDNIYDVSLQIAHAIISGDDRWLPYDDTDASLLKLTRSLKRDYQYAKNDRRTKPLSLNWKLKTVSASEANLYVNLNVVKEISSRSIEDLDYMTCYAFDVFVAGEHVGKYVRKSLERDACGEVGGAIYSRATVGKANDIKWNGELVVEVKIRCDNDQRLFPTLCGSYPPNFDYPQVFRMLDENVYALKSRADAEKNIVIFSGDWQCEGSRDIVLNGMSGYAAKEFTDEVRLHNSASQEDMTITNEFTPYSAEFGGTYIQWLEGSNYKLLTRVPAISVFDQEGVRVDTFRRKYRLHNGHDEWRNLTNACHLPFGPVDIKVEFPDHKCEIETFYFIGDLTFGSREEGMFSTELYLQSSHHVAARAEECEGLTIESAGENSWRISRAERAARFSPTCNIRVYAEDNPALLISVATPFEGIIISDVEGNVVPAGKIISYENLRFFNIISHGRTGTIDVTYYSDSTDFNEIKHLKRSVGDGVVPLSDYRDLFARMFQLYGTNTFDRSSGVVLRIGDNRVYIRKFVLESELCENQIRVTDSTEEDTTGFVYEGEVYALPVSEDVNTVDFAPSKLEPCEGQVNTFAIPEKFANSEVIIFSGRGSTRRLVPKYYRFGEDDFSIEERRRMSSDNVARWETLLGEGNVSDSDSWEKTVKAFRIMSEFGLPFATYNAFKVIGAGPRLLADFILACWYYDASKILIQEIDRLEDELNVAVHLIPRRVWGICFDTFINSLPEGLRMKMPGKLFTEFTPLVRELFNASLSSDAASELTPYVFTGEIGSAPRFSKADIAQFMTKIHGYADNNADLPLIQFALRGKYYADRQMLGYYRVMIESAMCAAENVAQVEGCINLFSPDHGDYARIANFYRNCFKETYSEIFIRTLKQINRD